MSEEYANLNPQERDKYSKAIKEMVDSLARMESEKCLMQEIAAQQKENFGIKPAVTNKAAKVAFKKSLEEDRTDAEEFFAWLEVTLGGLVK